MNAIVDKDYSGGSPIQISVYENKIYFWNDGQLPDNWTVEQLLSKHASKPFNPLIANAFFRAGMIESWGRGIEKINQECKAAGVPVPEYRTDASGLMVKFHTQVTLTGKTPVETPVKTQVETQVKTPDQILRMLDEKPEMTLAEVAQKIGKSLSAVERASSKLVKAGRLRFVGSKKGGHWEVKEKL